MFQFVVIATTKHLADKGQKNNLAYAGLFFYAGWPMRIHFFTGLRGGRNTTRQEFVFVGGVV